MIAESGKFKLGFEFKGKTYKEFSIRPRKIKDSFNEPDEMEKAQEGLYYLYKRTKIKGIDTKISFEEFSGLFDEDVIEIVSADRRLAEKLKVFRNTNETSKKNDSGSNEAGL